MSSHYDAIIHLVAGGLGGTAGAIVTCPLEVVKTRLQSSQFSYYVPAAATTSRQTWTRLVPCGGPPSTTLQVGPQQSLGIWACLRHIVSNEGTRALFKGLGPNLVGVAPSRAIYFCTYSNAKCAFSDGLPGDTPMPIVHILSAACAGFMSCTLTNPIWFVKTRLQLDQSVYGKVSAWHCIRSIYNTHGLSGFYKGITASYFGISETIIHFVLYEKIKAKLRERQHSLEFLEGDNTAASTQTTWDFIQYMAAGATSKTIASIVAYPHEVARTRLRQEGEKYHAFFQTILLVLREEGYTGLYRGLATQLVRQIPNTAIMMATYEAVVYLFTREHPVDEAVQATDDLLLLDPPSGVQAAASVVEPQCSEQEAAEQEAAMLLDAVKRRRSFWRLGD